MKKRGLLVALQAEGLKRGKAVVFANEMSHALHSYRYLFLTKSSLSHLEHALIRDISPVSPLPR